MRGFHVLVTLFCTRNIKDTQCGFKLFTRKAAKTLFASLHLERWAFDIELIYLAEQLKIPLKEVSSRIYICEHQQVFAFQTGSCLPIRYW